MPELTIGEIVGKAESGTLEVPEFQREFVWKPRQVAELVDSLSRDYPVGCLTFWDAPSQVGRGNDLRAVVDGQQRVTALCLILGSRPQWWEQSRWNQLLNIYRPYLNISLKDGDHQKAGDHQIGGHLRGAWLSVAADEITACQTADDITQLLRGKLDEAGTQLTSQVREALNEKVQQIWKIRTKFLPYVEMFQRDPLEAAEAYKRLNEAGTRIRETDTQLAFVAVYNPNWVRETFRPFLEQLKAKRWDVEPGLLLRTMSILDSGTARIGQVDAEFLRTRIRSTFEQLKVGITDLTRRLEQYGIYGTDELPSSYAIITLFALHAKFRELPGYDMDSLFRFFVGANITGRYGDAPLETLSRDGAAIKRANNLRALLDGDLKIAVDPDDLEKLLKLDFRTSSPQALLLKVLLWDHALDWTMGGKLSTVPPLEWHHIVPKKVCQTLGFAKGSDAALANRTLLSKTANQSFSDQPPWVYGPSKINDRNRLLSHYIPDDYVTQFMAQIAIADDMKYQDFLNRRRHSLLQAARTFLQV